MVSVEDKILISEISQRNRQVFEAFFHRHYAPLTRFAERMVLRRPVAEDIVQNLFIHFWEQAPTMRVTTSLRAYLFRAVKNRCLNHLRQLAIQDHHQLLYLEALLATEAHTPTGDIQLEQEIAAALSQLPPRMATVLVMKYRDGQTRQAIAQHLGISENTVKTQLVRGKARLRELLTDATQLYFFL